MLVCFKIRRISKLLSSKRLRLRFLRYSLWNKDLLDTHLDLLDTDITSKNFVCLRDVLKTSSRYVFKTSWRRLQRSNFLSSKTSSRSLARGLENVFKTSWRCLGRRKIVTLKTSWRCLQDILKTNKCLLGNVPFLYPLKTSKTSGFLTFSGVYKWIAGVNMVNEKLRSNQLNCSEI